VSVRLSIHLSVTSRTCTKTVKCRITQTTPYDSPDTLVLWRKRSLRNSDAIIPNGVLKVFLVLRTVQKSPAQSTYRRKFVSTLSTVVRVHDGALAEEYAMSSTMLVMVKVC